VADVSLNLSAASTGATTESRATRGLLIGVAVVFLALFLLLPLVTVFVEALRSGVGAYFSALGESDTVSSIRLTLIVAAISVPANLVFGLAASWAIAKFEFVGKSVLITLIDLPFSVSPVTSGLIYVLIFGAQGYLGPWLQAHHIQIIFALPGIALATVFVTFPFVARELIPIMQEQGTLEEEAAVSLGAGGWSTFLRNARAMGEFGAVSVVSGHIRGLTDTMPLQVEILYNDYAYAAAFAVASLLALLALVTLAVKTLLEWRFAGEIASQRRH